MSRTKSLVLMALFVALIACGAFIRIPIPAVPFTLQCLFTMMVGVLLGERYGALSVACYVAMGLIGLPVFTNGGGISYVLQPTFGYLLGFIPGAWLTGRLARLRQPLFWWLLAASLTGLAVIYAMGTLHFWLISRFYLNQAVQLWPMILTCALLPLPGDVLSAVAVALLGKRLIPFLRNKGIPPEKEGVTEQTNSR